MTTTDHEIQRRKEAALMAIKSVFETEEDEYGATLFVSHHLDEIDESYWQKHLGTESPTPHLVLDILELRSHWGDEDDDGIDTFDFTLPDGVTDYVISVRFNKYGQIEEISMES